MPNRVRFIDPGIIVQSGGGSGGETSISSSYALSASYADYAVSASHEIVKELSSSYADTASYAITASYALNAGTGGGDSDWYDGGTFITSSKDVQVTGSLIVSGSLEVQSGTSRMYFESGSSVGSDDGKILIKSTGGPSNISLWRTDGVQSALLTGTGGTGFYFSNTGYFGIQPTLNPAVQTSFGGATALYMEGATGKVGINTNNPLNRFYVAGIIGTNSDIIATGSITSSGLNVGGPSNFESGSITLDRTTVPSLPGDDDKINIGTGGSGAPTKAFQIYTNAGFVTIGPQNNSYSHFITDRDKFYFNKPIQVDGEVMSHAEENLVLGNNGGTSDTITIAQNDIIFELNNQNIFHMTTGSLGLNSIFSGSATSTASFGTYIGNGSQLTNLPSTFPFIGDAEITGSLVISGSFNAFRVNSTDIILGEDAGASIVNNTTQYNVLIGKQAANTMTTGDFNVFTGFRAAVNGLNPENNVAIGRAAGHSIGNSKNNVFIGYRSGYGRGVSQTNQVYSNNVGIGAFALNSLFENDYNVAIGRNALYLTKGESNIGIGYNAGYNQTTGDGNITIGSGSLGIAGESNQLRIGHADLHVISASLTTGDIIFYNTASSPNFSGSFQGDGSQLTNLPTQDPFPYTGSAIISGSLGITGSLNIVEGTAQTGTSNFFAAELNGSDTIQRIGSTATGLELHSDTQNTIVSSNQTASLSGYETTVGALLGTNVTRSINLGVNNTLPVFNNLWNIYLGGGQSNTKLFIRSNTTELSGSLTLSGSLLNTGTVSVNNGNGSPASPYTLTGTQQFILIDPSGGDITINMPDAATYPGREIKFKLTQAAGANTITLQRQGSDTIDGATTYTDLDVQYESISVVSNGSNGWFIF